MTILIVMIVVALLVNVSVGFFEMRASNRHMTPEWKFDDGVSLDDEDRAKELIKQYGCYDPIELNAGFVIHEEIKEFVSQYRLLAFDEYTIDYMRNELLSGEEDAPCLRGFYCIGGDGGEISFYVRRSTDDGMVYAFDMEGSCRPEPYSSNIRRFVMMRYNEWRKTHSLVSGEAHQSKSFWKKNTDRTLVSLGGIVVLFVDGLPLYYSSTFLFGVISSDNYSGRLAAITLGTICTIAFGAIALLALRSVIKAWKRV